jgi:hypothetical protein
MVALHLNTQILRQLEYDQVYNLADLFCTPSQPVKTLLPLILPWFSIDPEYCLTSDLGRFGYSVSLR